MYRLLLFILVCRPIIDLFWEMEFKGINLAGFVSIFFDLLISCIFLQSIFKKTKIRIFYSSFFLLIYSVIISLLLMKGYKDLMTVLRIVSGFIFLIYVPRKIDQRLLEKTFKWTIIMTIVPIIISYLQFLGLWKYTYFDYINSVMIPRASGGYRQPSVLTRFILLGIIYSIYFLFKSKSKAINRNKIYIFIYFIFAMFSLLISYHRTSYLLFIVIIFVSLVFYDKKKIIQNILKFLTMCFFVLVALLIINSFGILKLDLNGLASLVSSKNIFTIEDGHFELVLRGRGNIIDALMYNVKNAPLFYTIFGNGVNYNTYTQIDMDVADMDWIRMFWNFGLVGLFLWFAQIISFIRIIIYHKKHHFIHKELYFTSVLIFITYVVLGFTVEVTATPNIMYHVYFIFGVLLFYKYKKLHYSSRHCKNIKNTES